MTPTHASNPFVGLRPFEKGDAHLFFGRDEQVDHLLERLRSGRFVAVLGASGSGKSSLIRAGLLPALEGGFITKAGSSWRIAVLRPGASPIRSLALALSEINARPRSTSSPHVAMIEATIRRGSFGLIDALKEAGLRPGEQVMVVVDQFEELFTFKRVAASIGASDDAALFVKLMLAAVRHAGWPVHVVLTMRAEFLGTCSEFRELPEAISDGLFLIPRLNRDQLSQAITGPIAVAGARIAPSLVQRLLNDVGDDPDQLPVLQHALMRMWDRWKARGDGDQLALHHYEGVGELRQALSNHADEAFHSLNDPQKRIAQKVFKSLTERTEEGTDLRRPTALGELAEVAQSDLDATTAVVNVFRAEGRSFLTPSIAVPIVAESVVDISHESLIRQWNRLNVWAGEEFDDRSQYRRVDQAAAGHAARSESLWRGPALTSTLKWRDQFKPTDAWARRYGGSLSRAMTFLDRSRMRRRLITGAIAASLTGGVIVTGWQLEKSHRMADELALSRVEAANAEAEKAKAVAAAAKADAEIAEARNTALKTAYELGNSHLKTEQALLERDKEAAARQRETDALRQRNVLMRADLGTRGSATGNEVAALVAVHMARRARQTGDPEAVKEAESALQKHLALLPPLRWKGSLDGAVTALTVASDGQLVASGDDSSDPSDAQVFSAAGKPVPTPDLKVDPGAASVAVSADARTVAWTSDDKLHRWTRDGPPRAPLTEAFFEDTRKLVLSANGRLLLGLNNGGVRLWDLESGQASDLYRGSSTAIAFSPDGTTAAAAVRTGKDNILMLWDVRTPAQTIARIPITGAAAAQKIVFSAKGTFLAVAAGNSLHAWRLLRGAPDGLRAESIGPNEPFHSRPVKDVAFSANEQLLATASDDGTAVVLRLSTTPLTPRGVDTVRHEGAVNAVAFSPDGRTLATGSDDGTARAWRGTRWPEAARVGHSKPVRAVAFLPDGSLMSGAFDRTVKVSTLAPIAAARSLGEGPGALFSSACSKLSRNLSADEWLEYFTTDDYVSACTELAIDPKDLLQLQLKHALNGNAAAAHKAFQQFRDLKNIEGVELELLLETSTAQARVRNRDDARVLLSHAPRLASTVRDPFELVDIAKQLLETGARTEAVEVLQRATKLAMSGDDPDPLALIGIAGALREAGRANEAGEILTGAMKLAADLTDPSDLVDMAVALAGFGRRAEASDVFARAGKLALAPAAPRGSDNNNVCWFGAIYDFPAEVLANCEAAVKVTTDARNLASYRDSRGVAHALLGKTELARADFEAFVTNRSAKDPEGIIRARWVNELKEHRNPFATDKEKVLAALRREQ